MTRLRPSRLRQQLRGRASRAVGWAREQRVLRRVLRPEVSVIVPFYDVEEYFEECLETIAGQNFRNFEAMFHDAYYWNALLNMGFYLLAVIVEYAIAFGLALLLNAEIRARKAEERARARANAERRAANAHRSGQGPAPAHRPSGGPGGGRPHGHGAGRPHGHGGGPGRRRGPGPR